MYDQRLFLIQVMIYRNFLEEGGAIVQNTWKMRNLWNDQKNFKDLTWYKLLGKPLNPLLLPCVDAISKIFMDALSRIHLSNYFFLSRWIRLTLELKYKNLVIWLNISLILTKIIVSNYVLWTLFSFLVS